MKAPFIGLHARTAAFSRHYYFLAPADYDDATLFELLQYFDKMKGLMPATAPDRRSFLSILNFGGCRDIARCRNISICVIRCRAEQAVLRERVI